MFRILFIFSFSLIIGSSLHGQSNVCGTQFGLEEMSILIKNKKMLSNQEKREDFIYVPVKFHLAAKADGEGRVLYSAILEQLCELNLNYEAYGYKFYMKDGTVNNVDNNTIYSSPSTGAGITKMAAQKQEFGSNAINIFVTENADNGAEGNTLGYYTFNQDWIVLKKSVPQNSSHVRWVLAHEIGHFFSLPHTFNGWDNDPWDGTPVTSTLSPGGVLNELADGSNSDVAGDMIEDTPADYNLGFGWNGCATYDGGCTDPTGALLNPDEENFMGYFIGCSEYNFSDKQAEIIDNSYNSSRRSYLRISYQPSDQPISETPQLVAPADDSTTPFYNGVELSWSAVENATDYFVEISQGLSKMRYNVKNNKIFLTDLKENKTYRWKVLPYNELNTCAQSSPTWQFKTGTNTTSTDDETLAKHKVAIIPNPSSNNEIRIKIDDNYSLVIKAELFSLDGKTMHTKNFDRSSGEWLTINNLNISNGFYILRLNIDGEDIIKKVIVHE